MDVPPTPFRYLNALYINEKIAAPSVNTNGGHRADSIPVPVPVHDARPTRPFHPKQIADNLQRHGHSLIDFTPQEWNTVEQVNMKAMEHNPQLQKTYFSMCESLALRATGASYARAFDFTLRDSRIKGVHTKPGGDNSARGPVNGVHTDYTNNSPGVQSIKHLLYNKMGLGKDVQFSLINVWRNISDKGPIQTWPLAVCDADSVDPSELIERITPENNNVIYNLLPNPNRHQWRYYSNMHKNECLVFKQYDTNTKTARFTPHTAFDVLSALGQTTTATTAAADNHNNKVPPRESCEVRVLLVFDDEGRYYKHLQRTAEWNGTVAKRSNISHLTCSRL